MSAASPDAVPVDARAGDDFDPGGSRPTVLAVDDDRVLLEVLRDVLGDLGYGFVGHCRRAGALDLIRSSCPVLVLLDLRLDAGATGWEVLEEMRNDARCRSIPVILLSAATDELERYAPVLAPDPRLRTLGKPFDLDDLCALIEDLLDPPRRPNALQQQRCR